MSSATLTSLAMLKVNVDQEKDYLDYLRPFILQVLFEQKPDPVIDRVVRDHLRLQFGLEIPERAIQIILKRLSRKYPIKREAGVYRISGTIPDPGIVAEKAKAARHIQAVISGLIEFAKFTGMEKLMDDEAVTAVCAFLSEFNIPCLRAYLRGTTIPAIENKNDSHIVLVSEYVIQLQKTDPERFDSFMIMVQGHMLANALLCPDLINAPKTYKNVTFYLDTPLLIQRFGLEGESKKAAVENLIGLLHNLGAVIAVFSHSREEIERVLKGAAEHIGVRNGRGAIVMEARRSGITKSDLLILIGQINDKLAEARIVVKNTPRYISAFQIDEMAFEKVLEDEVSYFNPRAKEYDINSLRSIYVLRAQKSPTNIESSQAVLVSSNAGFARAAYEYGQRHKESHEVSCVITDFSLANMAWLKAPMGAPSIPMTELLAYSYAALQPSKVLLDKYLLEIDKLQKKGKISERDHQLLRCSTIAQEEMMRLTLGDEAALTEETLSETLHRVTDEIKKEENRKFRQEAESHKTTQKNLASIRAERETLQKRIYWKCKWKSKLVAWAVSFVAFTLAFAGVVAGFAAGLGLRLQSPVIGWILLMGSLFLAVGTLTNLCFGITLRHLFESVQAKCLTYLLRQEARATGINFGASE